MAQYEGALRGADRQIAFTVLANVELIGQGSVAYLTHWSDCFVLRPQSFPLTTHRSLTNYNLVPDHWSNTSSSSHGTGARRWL
jgi:hypothetical protein